MLPRLDPEVMKAPERGYDWANYFIWQSETIAKTWNTSNDSASVFITVGASTSVKYVGLQVSHVSKKKKALSTVLDI